MIELSPSAVIGQYKLIKKLREPLQSHSWLAEAADGQLVVLKLFEKNADRDGPPERESFKQLLRLHHPALETSWTLFEDSNWTGFARAYYQDFSHPGEQRFELDRMLALGMRLAEALQVSHDAGLAHGSLQRSNLFTRDNNQLIVTDPCSVTGNARATADGSADLQACGNILASWTDNLEENHPRSSDENGGLLLPPRLTWLIEALKQPDENLPGEGFARVRDELYDIRLQWQRALKEGIPANWSGGQADYRPDTSVPSEPLPPVSRHTMWKPIAGAVLLMVLLVGAIWILPAYFVVQEPRQVVQKPASSEDVATGQPEPPTEEELAALLAQREQAQTVLDELINLRLQLEGQGVTRWAEKAFSEAIILRDAGDRPYRDQDFTLALEIYSRSRDAMQLIADKSRQVVRENIGLGNQALGRGDSASAEELFGLALGIDPENTAASRGLARALSLDAVLALMHEADAREESGAWEEARESLREIRKLDPDTDGIDAEIRRLDLAIGQRKFRSAMSEALASLDAGELPQARAAFNRAQRLQPSALGPREGLQEVSRQERDLSVLQQRELALAQEQSENWKEALTLYQALLQQDPNLKFAQDGVVRARDRANLDSELVRYLARPSSWWSSNGRTQAQSLLVEARSVAKSGPRLQAQKQQLAVEIKRAGSQVPIVLQSDNLCNVLVYKVGRLGQFQTTQLALYPGYYTAVGIRDGYRDTRKDFLVQPEQQQAVTITCDEKI